MSLSSYLPSEKQFDELYGEGVMKKLRIIGDIDTEMKSMLDDYLSNESAAMRWNPNIPPKRIEEFNAVCAILQTNTLEKICEILDGHMSVLKFGTERNREYILKKFEIWMGE